MNTDYSEPSTTGTDIADQATHTATGAIRSTQAMAQGLINRAAEKAQSARDQAVPAIDRLADGLDSATRRSIDTVRDSAARAREQAAKVQDVTVNYIQQAPLKSVLVAAATGAVLMALVGMLSRSRSAD